MNKNIKDYIEKADYDELFDIMECANNRILNLVAIKENPMEWLMYVMKVAVDYKERLHLVLAPQEQYHCNCVDYDKLCNKRYNLSKNNK